MKYNILFERDELRFYIHFRRCDVIYKESVIDFKSSERSNGFTIIYIILYKTVA